MRMNGQIVRISRLFKGTDKNDKEYVSYRGAIKVGEEGHLYDFEGMVYKLTKEGKVSKTYERAVNWFGEVYDAIQESREIPEIFASLSGSLEPMDYVASSGELRETTVFRVSQIYDFTKDAYGDDAYVTLEGYVRSIAPEIDPKTEEETGNLIISLIGLTFKKDAIVIPKIIVENEGDGVNFVNSNYEVGAFTKATLGFKWTNSNPTPSRVGMGRVKDNVVSRSTREFFLMGMDVPREDDDISKNKELIKELLSERKMKLDAIEEEGYKGSGEKNSSKAPTRGFGKGKASSVNLPVDDDDIPF